MGAPAQENAPTQVYYDPQKQQYFSYKQEAPNPLANIFLASGLPVTVNGKPYTQGERVYLNNPYVTQDRFTPKYIPSNYPEMSELFPALDIGLAQNLQNNLLAPTDATQSSGAGRFLAPSTSKGK